MKKFYILIFCAPLLLFSANTSFAQESIEIDFNQNSTDWVKYKTLDLADIYYKLTNCNEIAQKIFFKVVNKSEAAVSIDWEYKFFLGDEEVVRAPDDMIVQFTLEPVSSDEGSCEFSTNNKLSIFVAEIGGSIAITKIDLINIKINQN